MDTMMTKAVLATSCLFMLAHPVLGGVPREDMTDNYIFIDTSQRDWREANTYCLLRFGTRLATVKSSADQNELMTLLLRNGGEPKWIGAYSEGRGKATWAQDGSSAYAHVTASWHLKEASYEWNDCFAIDQPSGKWFDFPCTRNMDFACNKPGGKYAPHLDGSFLDRADLPSSVLLPSDGVNAFKFSYFQNDAAFVAADVVISAVVCLLILSICGAAYFCARFYAERASKAPRYKIVDEELAE
jgi:hypothetical protein